MLDTLADIEGFLYELPYGARSMGEFCFLSKDEQFSVVQFVQEVFQEISSNAAFAAITLDNNYHHDNKNCAPTPQP